MKSTEWVSYIALATMCVLPMSASAEPYRVQPAPMTLTLPLSPAQEALLKQRAKQEATGPVMRKPARPQPRGFAQHTPHPLGQYGYQYSNQSPPHQSAPSGLQGYATVTQPGAQGRYGR